MTGPELKDLREDLGAAIGPAAVGRQHGKARRPRAGKRRGHLAQMEDSAGPSGPVATLMSICGSPAILSVRHRTCCGVMCLPAIAGHTHARRQHRARNPRSAPRSRNASPRNTFLERRKELETNRLYTPQNYAIELAAEISEFTKKEGHAKKFDYHPPRCCRDRSRSKGGSPKYSAGTGGSRI